MKKTLLNLTVAGSCLLAGCGDSAFDNKARVFTTEEGVKVIRTYEARKVGKIFVQTNPSDSVYVSLKKYLERFEGYDRQIEDAKIKKLVGW